MMGKRCDSKLLGDMGNFFPPAFILLTCELFRKQRKNRLYPATTRLLLVIYVLTLNITIMHTQELATIHTIYSVT